MDDHGLWDPDQQDQEQQKQREQKWQGVSEKTQTGLETVLAGKATGGEAVLEQVRVAVRDDVDYRAFLRRFAAPREVLAVDDDAFDYIFYTYGLQHYGNMPLVEPLETREEKRIQTSSSRWTPPCPHPGSWSGPFWPVPMPFAQYPDLYPEGEHPDPPV